MKLSVIIVNYNVKHYVEQCLCSLYAAQGNLAMEIFVVDNASHDSSVEYLTQQFPKEKYPNLHIIGNARNIGFGKANNLAVAKAVGEYILYLNPDTIVTEDTLRDAVQYADSHPDMGALGTMMLHSNGTFAYESRRGLPTPWTALCKMSGLCNIFPKSHTFGRYYMRYLDEEKPAEIEIVSGAFFMARREALLRTGLFDEDFFMYGEDIDLSYRLLKKGYKNHYIPSPILHYKGESTHKSTFRYVHIFYNAMLIFFKKHYRHYGIGLTLPIKTAIIIKAMLAVVAQNIQKAKDFIIPPKDMQDHYYIYIGRNSHKMKEIAERWCLDVKYIDGDRHTMPHGELPEGDKKRRTHIIYDTHDFDYRYILEAFRRSTHKAYIGTFYPDKSIAITYSDIFTLNPTDNL